MTQLLRFYLTTSSVFLLLVGAVMWGIGFTLSIINTPENRYTIISKNDTYHTETFRMYGKGIVFESEGEDIILMGDIDIKCKSNR